MKMRTVEIGDIDLEIAEAGTGAPLFLLHGFTGAKEDFTDWLDPFADRGWHAISPDLRGHGGSGAPTEESAYTLATFAGDVLGLADAFGWDRFCLLGHSMGGMVAQAVALQAPERVERLILMDTTHAPVEGIDRSIADLAVAMARERGIDALADAIAALDSPLATEADARVRAERPGYVEFGDRKFRASSPAMYAAMVPEMFEQDDRIGELRSLTMPVLVVVGDQDEPFIPASRSHGRGDPGRRLEIVPEAGHSPQFEAPEAWWKVVSEFLGEPNPRWQRSRDSSAAHRAPSPGLVQEVLTVNHGTGDLAGRDQSAPVADRHGEDEAPALDPFELGVGHDVVPDDRRREMVDLHPHPDARLTGLEPSGDGLRASLPRTARSTGEWPAHPRRPTGRSRAVSDSVDGQPQARRQTGFDRHRGTIRRPAGRSARRNPARCCIERSPS